MKVASLTLSTLSSGKYAPMDKSNLANVKWIIDWKEVLGEYFDTNKPCRVKCTLITASSSSMSSLFNLGTVRASFSSNYSNINNAVNSLGINFYRRHKRNFKKSMYVYKKITMFVIEILK